MNVVIVGYGRMGRLIEEILNQRGHTVTCRVDLAGSGDTEQLSSSVLEGADGVIEFALADGIMDRFRVYSSSDVPVVIGTTGWDQYKEEAKALYKDVSGAVLWGSNFSLGAHLFFRLTSVAAKLLNRATEYDVSLTEYHHAAKADYPSGTAITAAEGIIAALDRKKTLIRNLPEGPIPKDALHVGAVRMGSIPGIHEMRMDSPADFLTIRHEARGREGFALGAVRGLEWLQTQKGWHDAKEFIDYLLEE